MSSERITMEEVAGYTRPSDGFLCPLSANVWGIEFLAFSIRNVDSGEVVFEVSRPETDEPLDLSQLPAEFDLDQLRSIHYDFPARVLDFKTIGTTLTFRVGEEPVQNFYMIEHHFFRDTLLQSFGFEIPFCMPKVTNTWENIYDVPELSPELKADMVDSPGECSSDSYYFVDGELVMHNKASYSYVPDDA